MSSSTFGRNLINPITKLFDKPKAADIPQQEEVEEVSTVTQDAADAQRRKKKDIKQGGKQSTVLSGIQSALKKRLGE